MCLTSCNTFQKHLLSQKENLIFWPQKWIFEISEAIFDSFWHPNMRKRHGKATLKVSKKILRPSIKNRLDTFVPNVLGINLIPFSWSYDQNWLRETLKTEKKAKTPPRSTFWNNRLQMLTKFFHQNKHTKLSKKHIYTFFIASILFSQIRLLWFLALRVPFKNVMFIFILCLRFDQAKK